MNTFNHLKKITISKLSILLTASLTLLFIQCSEDEEAAPPPTLPIITGAEVTQVSVRTATISGGITSDGGSAITVRGFCWSTEAESTLEGNLTTEGSGKGNFSSSLTGLLGNTTYFVRGYATNELGTTYSDVISFTTITPELTPGGILTDVDGNNYNTIVIEGKRWMTENLRVTHYQNGEALATETDNETWKTLTTGALCYYENDKVTYEAVYGALYNGFAVVDERKLCPSGWHVPTKEEWYILIDSYGGDEIAGARLKEAGLTHWNQPNPEADNASGFSSRGAGQRYTGNSTFIQLKTGAHYWTSTPSTWGLVSYYLNNTNTIAYQGAAMKHGGYSVRCVED